ncbi:methylmalonyl Co-A mutase-associated GTPase MeaB [Natranaerofaba carboxydovora]|uniref:methylmalonyl Co-A mutase-associated GTPase MeaB n=1 Tax=Natranaerofaba carboxydovora TaxID=2742683 RepID=UPI001F131EEF|nr:methylmalonyl Co-A mutase-associated GTPase MeaB [Natranaerofaba carboxydovora]
MRSEIINTNIHWEDPRSVARAISLVERRDESLEELMEKVYPKTGSAHIIGITGAPGAGKSSLVNQLVKNWRSKDLKIGIIAVDPSSPFSGGAILGDRIRMQEHSMDPGVYIRSMASRGSLGGVSAATRETISILDSAGYDILIIETVGVGQSEVDIVKMADTNIVVLTPAGGDSIQTMKAGIMEIGDIFVINKSDLPGSRKMQREVEVMLESFSEEGVEYIPPVVQTAATGDTGIEELTGKISEHQEYLKSSKRWEELRKKRSRDHVVELVKDNLMNKIEKEMFKRQEGTLMNQVEKREIPPHKAAREIVEDMTAD